MGREAHVIVALLEGVADDGPAAGSLVASLLTATHTGVEQVRVERLNAEILHGVVRLRRGGKEIEVAARLGEVIALAVQVSAPISVADEIMAAASWDLSDCLPVVGRILPAHDEASLRRAAAEPIIDRVAQTFLERGMRYVREEDEHQSAEVMLETR